MSETLYWYQPDRLSIREIMQGWIPASEPAPWTWEQESRDILERICVCCDRPGHYQFLLLLKMLDKGEFWGQAESPILGYDGRIWDGHHRILAAAALGWESLGVRLATPVPESA